MFIQNFLIKIAVLYITLYCNKLQIHTATWRGIRKIVFASAIGTVIEIVGLLLGNSYTLFVLLVNILEIPIMFLWILGFKRKRHSQKAILIFSGYFSLMLKWCLFSFEL